MVGLYSFLQGKWMRHVIANNKKGSKKGNPNTRKRRHLSYVRSRGRGSSELLMQGMLREQQRN